MRRWLHSSEPTRLRLFDEFGRARPLVSELVKDGWCAEATLIRYERVNSEDSKDSNCKKEDPGTVNNVNDNHYPTTTTTTVEEDDNSLRPTDTTVTVGTSDDPSSLLLSDSLKLLADFYAQDKLNVLALRSPAITLHHATELAIRRFEVHQILKQALSLQNVLVFRKALGILLQIGFMPLPTELLDCGY